MDDALRLGDIMRLPNLAEVWALSGSRRQLATHAVRRGRTAFDAFQRALKNLVDGGLDLARVHGALIVLWNAPD